VSCPPIRLLSSLPVRHNILDLPFPFVCPSRFVLTPFQLLRLVLAARSRDKLKKVALKCRNFGCEVAIVPTDVSKPKQCKALISETVRIFNRLDYLVLNAGVSMHIAFEDLKDLEIFHKLMDTNYFGYVYTTHFALPYLRKSPHPRIVVISSLSGETGVPLRTGYCASKFAVNGFFEALRTELGSSVPITIVSPGYVDTEIRQNSYGPKEFKPATVGRMMAAKRCADLIVDAADQGKRKVVLTLSGKLVYAFRPFVPELVDMMVKRQAHQKKAAL